MKNKIKKLIKRAIPFSIALFIFISSFCIPSFAVSSNSIGFSDFFRPSGDETAFTEVSFLVNNTDIDNPYVSNQYARISFDNNTLVIDEPTTEDGLFPNGVIYLKIYMSVKDVYRRIPYNSYFKFDFSLDNYSKYYYQGGGFLSSFKAVCTLVGDNIINGVLSNDPSWNVGVTFDFTKDYLQFYAFTFYLPVYVIAPTDNITFDISNSIIDVKTDTDIIIDNQDKNTDTVINGWQNDSSIDYGATDDYLDKETQVHNNLKPGLDDTTQIVGGLQDNIQDSKFNIYNGVLAFTQCMNILMDDRYGLKPISIIVGVSLSLGLFSFVLGMIQMLSKIGSGHNKNNYNNNYKKKKGG